MVVNGANTVAAKEVVGIDGLIKPLKTEEHSTMLAKAASYSHAFQGNEKLSCKLLNLQEGQFLFPSQ
jgi:hypothetical protein